MSERQQADSPKTDFAEVETAAQVLDQLAFLPEGSVIFCDIDDTVITPRSSAFRAGAGRNMIDEIKKDKHNIINYLVILSNWRLQRQIMLMDAHWPAILQQLKEKYRVYGLTQMDTGQFGNIEFMEDWRYRELKKLGIEFTLHERAETVTFEEKKVNAPSFYKGIFFTGSASKAGTLALYKNYLAAPCFVLIDDRKSHLEDVQAFCVQERTPFLGILYDGMKTLTGLPDSDIMDFQKQYLIETARWLEDEEAQDILHNNQKQPV